MEPLCDFYAHLKPMLSLLLLLLFHWMTIAAAYCCSLLVDRIFSNSKKCRCESQILRCSSSWKTSSLDVARQMVIPPSNDRENRQRPRCFPEFVRWTAGSPSSSIARQRRHSACAPWTSRQESWAIAVLDQWWYYCSKRFVVDCAVVVVMQLPSPQQRGRRSGWR